MSAVFLTFSNLLIGPWSWRIYNPSWKSLWSFWRTSVPQCSSRSTRDQTLPTRTFTNSQTRAQILQIVRRKAWIGACLHLPFASKNHSRRPNLQTIGMSYGLSSSYRKIFIFLACTPFIYWFACILQFLLSRLNGTKDPRNWIQKLTPLRTLMVWLQLKSLIPNLEILESTNVSRPTL